MTNPVIKELGFDSAEELANAFRAQAAENNELRRKIDQLTAILTCRDDHIKLLERAIGAAGGW